MLVVLSFPFKLRMHLLNPNHLSLEAQNAEGSVCL
jgi:hypothetical protein